MGLDNFGTQCAICPAAAKGSGWCARHEAEFGSTAARRPAAPRPRAVSFLSDSAIMRERGARGKAVQAADRAAKPPAPPAMRIADGEDVTWVSTSNRLRRERTYTGTVTGFDPVMGRYVVQTPANRTTVSRGLIESQNPDAVREPVTEAAKAA